MPLAFAAIGLGVLLLVSGFKGHSIADILIGKGAGSEKPLDPKGADIQGILAGLNAASAPLTSDVPGNLTTIPGNVTDVHLSILTSECNRIAALKLPYVWGGGHVGYSPNGPFDCSGAVSYVLHAAGMLNGPPRTSGLLMAWGQAGKGQHLTVYANFYHTFLEVDGRQWGTSESNPGGGPGWFSGHPTSGYSARHFSGL